ncbi:hypothetical protein [Streptomyces sp. NBC_01363]|nr:hypothetical protein [Streptomyces sp. NBC_01363]MCX4731366.1 hypothetical protein [Streptomyces sp. NBC_01363]
MPPSDHAPNRLRPQALRADARADTVEEAFLHLVDQAATHQEPSR